MKTLKLIAVGIILFASSAIHAQVSVSLNIGSAPSWGPVGYAEAEYYYLPDVEAYYDVRATQFIYFGGGRWVRSRYLPRQYRNYDLYSGYKVVLNDYHGSRPYNNFNHHKVKYYRGYHGREQRTIGYNNNRRQYDNHRQYDNRREYDNHRENKGRDHGNNGRGNRNGHGNDRD
nr:hypothetical protein [uncultured Flavobacterium sp.]